MEISYDRNIYIFDNQGLRAATEQEMANPHSFVRIKKLENGETIRLLEKKFSIESEPDIGGFVRDLIGFESPEMNIETAVDFYSKL